MSGTGKKSTQLIEVETDAHLWSNTWDRDLADVFAIQDEIAAAVVDELRVQLLGELPHATETDSETYMLYLQARHTISQRTHESLLRGEELINKALEIDPDYVPGWVLKARLHSEQGDVGARLPLDVMEDARAAVDKALALDPNNAAAYAASGDLMLTFERKYEEAGREFARALELDPNNFDALQQSAIFHAFTGHPERGLPLSLAAYERDPLFTSNHSTLGYMYSLLGRHEEGEAMFRERIALAPDSYGSHYYLAISLALQERYEEALETVAQEPLDGFRLTYIVILNWYLGNREVSDEAMVALKARQKDGWDWQLVQAHAVRGEIDEAFAAMEAAYQNRDSGLQLILGDVHLGSLRDDPRYEAMVQRMGIRLE